MKHGPRPTCCDKINVMSGYFGHHEKPHGPYVQLRVIDYVVKPGETTARPRWEMLGADNIMYCPYCGKKLPEVELVPSQELPKQTTHWSSDGNYCDSCHERNMCCECLPPSAAYRIKGTAS